MSFGKQQRALLTGGAGFIGSHLAEALLLRGHDLSIIDSLDDFYAPAAKRSNLDEIRKMASFRFFELDLRDPGTLFCAAQEAQPDDLAIRKFATLMEAGRPIPVFGDGSAGPDCTFVDDIVAGVLVALPYQFPQEEAVFYIVNLGNSHPVSLNERDAPLIWASTDKAARLLGYNPGLSPRRSHEICELAAHS